MRPVARPHKVLFPVLHPLKKQQRSFTVCLLMFGHRSGRPFMTIGLNDSQHAFKCVTTGVAGHSWQSAWMQSLRRLKSKAQKFLEVSWTRKLAASTSFGCAHFGWNHEIWDGLEWCVPKKLLKCKLENIAPRAIFQQYENWRETFLCMRTKNNRYLVFERRQTFIIKALRKCLG